MQAALQDGYISRTGTPTHILHFTHLHPRRILFSAEGIELVVAAWKGGAAGVPAPLLANAGQYDFSTSNTELNYAMFLRPSALSTAGPVAIDEWWGVNDNTPGDFIGTAAGAYMLSSTTWLLWQSSHDSWTGGNKVGSLGWLACGLLKDGAQKDAVRLTCTHSSTSSTSLSQLLSSVQGYDYFGESPTTIRGLDFVCGCSLLQGSLHSIN